MFLSIEVKCTIEKNKSGKESKESWVMKFAILNRRETERGEGTGHVNTGRRAFQAEGTVNQSLCGRRMGC